MTAPIVIVPKVRLPVAHTDVTMLLALQEPSDLLDGGDGILEFGTMQLVCYNTNQLVGVFTREYGFQFGGWRSDDAGHRYAVYMRLGV